MAVQSGDLDTNSQYLRDLIAKLGTLVDGQAPVLPGWRQKRIEVAFTAIGAYSQYDCVGSLVEIPNWAAAAGSCQNHGANVVETASSQAWDLGVVAHDSHMTQDFLVSDGVRSWLDNCRAYGSTYSLDIASADIAYTHNCQIAVKYGLGKQIYY
jgi:hypothetical protein